MNYVIIIQKWTIIFRLKQFSPANYSMDSWTSQIHCYCTYAVQLTKYYTRRHLLKLHRVLVEFTIRCMPDVVKVVYENFISFYPNIKITKFPDCKEACCILPPTCVYSVHTHTQSFISSSIPIISQDLPFRPNNLSNSPNVLN